MERWNFGKNNDYLLELVLSGVKTATTSLYSDYDKDNIPKKRDKSIITYENGKDACIIENTNVTITRFKNITKEMAYLEGEGDRTLGYYRKTHLKFFKNIDSEFDDGTTVVFEEFKVIKIF